MTQEKSKGLWASATAVLFGSSKKLEQVAPLDSFSGQIDFSNELAVSSATIVTVARVPKGEIGQTEKTVTALTNAGMESAGPILNAFAYKKYPIVQKPLPRSIKSSAFGPSSEVGFSDKAILLYKKVNSSPSVQPLQEASDTKTLVALKSTDLAQRRADLGDYEITLVIDEEVDIEPILNSTTEDFALSEDNRDFPQIPGQEKLAA